MKMIDKAIALNFKMIKERLQMIMVLCICIAICISFLIFIPIALILGIVIIYMLIKIYETLFIDSTFGESESMYNALPIPTNEAVVSRIFVGVIATVTAEVLTIIALIIGISVVFEGPGLIDSAVGLLGGLYEEGIITILLALISMLAEVFFVVTMTFATCVQSYIKTGKGNLGMVSAVFLVVTLKYSAVARIGIALLDAHAIPFHIGCIAVYTLVSVLAVRYVRNKLESY